MFFDRQEQVEATFRVNDFVGSAGYPGKRLFDIVFALCLLPIIAPLIALLWVLVRLDGGPGFFAHQRVGQGGRTFACWKLRTMVPDAERRLHEHLAADSEIAREWFHAQKLKEDPRITPLGVLLRKTSMDELPQLWNILAGEMSFVGPRPFTQDQLPLYVAFGGAAYFQLRPGITGPWQVFGRSATRFIDRVQFDEAYSRACSFLGDLALMLSTVKVVLKMTGR